MTDGCVGTFPTEKKKRESQEKEEPKDTAASNSEKQQQQYQHLDFSQHAGLRHIPCSPNTTDVCLDSRAFRFSLCLY